jgi:hypothetical protein
MLMKQPQGKPHYRKEYKSKQRKSSHRYKIRVDGKTQCNARAHTEGERGGGTREDSRAEGYTWVATVNF